MGIQNVTVQVVDPNNHANVLGAGTTDPNGNYWVNVAPGTYDVMFTPSDSSYLPSTKTGVSLTTDATLNVMLAAPAPATPTGLVAHPPVTNSVPVLSWGAANYATSYNVYRDGTLIGNTSQLTFTDSSLVAGANVSGIYNYTVTAVNSSGESQPSTALPVTYDIDPPIISASATKEDGSNYSPGTWSDQSVTVHFTCSDALSGIATCPADTVVTTDTPTSGTPVAGMATDSAGNTTTSSPLIVEIDKTAPSIVASATTADGNAYTAGAWTNQSVTVHFSCSDSLSGIASCPADDVVNSNTTATGEDVTGTATDNAGNSATTPALNVKVDKTGPSIIATATKADGGNYTSGTWVNQTVTVHFTCTDSLSGVASCPADQVLSNDTGTAGQDVVGTATDNAGNTTTSSTINVKIDEAVPTVGAITWAANSNPKATTATASFTASAADALSGVAGGEYFIGTDPGQSNGTTMTYSGGSISGTIGTGLAPGVYTVGVRSKDNAGNWSTVVTDYLVVYDPAGTGMTGKSHSLVPSLGNGDNLPGLISATQSDNASYAFTAGYNNAGTFDNNSKLIFDYNTGANCGKANATNCHTFHVDTLVLQWIVINGTNNSHGLFQGTANVTVDGVTTTNPIRVDGIDGDLLSGPQDHFLLTVYAPGADPNTASPIYQGSGDVGLGNGIKIR